MREIKFRGKRKDDGDWVYGDLITKPIHHDCAILEGGCINYSVIPETVGQFTGLKDKAGKEIFEGDIVKVFKGHKNRIKHNYKVIFHEGSFCLDPIGYAKHISEKPISFIRYFDECIANGLSDNGWEYLGVIGNIHEHPEPLTHT